TAPEPSSGQLAPAIRGQIEFEDVTFHYPGSPTPAIKDISFTIEPGQMVGIVGRSGSGKTTITRLIQGLYLPSEGRIIVDGNDLSKILLSTYRHRIGVVSQSEYYFRGTVRENISFYKPDA